ncbi:LuxR C-terminal-related transcriptional regulator [Sinanaerobacter sp. ZZT-01]|uniref:LuxR C-terminal-related transcriptional regulator n=1 Tax=Sinanaerobacter sp. ZZT-01 TaxID=3111540 RepID=UPI002D78952D|nr:LuxR C-terminal-related transcriptional regulator [Sinanaerobacter sp. ZZT-01]WRR94445.1 LuxR C-terminal-related transcriptional regulator [Sinanaerobacter sp. ZZT-01]
MNTKTMENDIYKDFKDLSVDELINGYVNNPKTGEFSCIFCGETFENGIIYPNAEKLFTAEKAVSEHVKEEHGGSFNVLINLDKQICGLSEIQKSILTHLYERDDNKTICEAMNISAATVRTHKFNLQKAKREAKILLALIQTAEEDPLLSNTKPREKTSSNEEEQKSMFEVNSLHPFFTQYRFK